MLSPADHTASEALPRKESRSARSRSPRRLHVVLHRSDLDIIHKPRPPHGPRRGSGSSTLHRRRRPRRGPSGASGKIAPSSAPATPRGYREAQNSLRRGLVKRTYQPNTAKEGQDARFSCAHAHPCRPCRPEGPSRQGPPPADGLSLVPGRVRTRRQFARSPHRRRAGPEWPAANLFRRRPRRDRRRRGLRDQPRKVGNAVTRNRIRRRLRALVDRPRPRAAARDVPDQMRYRDRTTLL